MNFKINCSFIYSFMSSSPKTSGTYSTNCCYQQSPYGTTNPSAQYSLLPSTHPHQQLVSNNVSPTSLSMVYNNGQQQLQQATSSSPPYATTSALNVLHTLSPTRYQNPQINDKLANNSTTVVTNGQVQTMPVNNVTNSAALAAATAYRRNFNACAKPPYRYARIFLNFKFQLLFC